MVARGRGSHCPPRYWSCARINVFDAGIASAGGVRMIPSLRAAGMPIAQWSIWCKKERRDVIVLYFPHRNPLPGKREQGIVADLYMRFAHTFSTASTTTRVSNPSLANSL